jgi:O-antigen/teichoic acid export membrane protein
MSFAKNVSHTVITNILLLAVQILTSVFVARMLGPSLNGTVTLVLTIPMMLFMFGNLGLGSAFSYYSANRLYPPRYILGSSLLSALALSSLAGLFFAFSFPLHKTVWIGVSLGYLIFGVLLTHVYMLNNFLLRIAIGRKHIRLMNNINLISSLIKLALILLFVCIGIKIGGILAASTISMITATVFTWRLLTKESSVAYKHPQLIYNSLTYGLKVYGMLFVNYLNLRADMFLVKYYTHDDAAVGFYSIAVAVVEMLWLLPDSVVIVLFPEIASTPNDATSIEKTIHSVRWNFLAMLLGAAGIVLFSKTAIVLLYGEQYLPSLQPLLYLLPGAAIYPIFKILNVDLGARGFAGYGTICSIIGFTSNFIANIILIPILGIIGASLASTISYSLMAVLSLYFFHKVTQTTLMHLFSPRSDKILSALNMNRFFKKTQR